MKAPNGTLTPDVPPPKFSRRRWLVSAVLVLALAIGVALLLNREPPGVEFEGRAFRDRLADLALPGTQPYETASRAVIELGAEGLPTIARVIDDGVPLHIRGFLRIQGKLPRRVQLWAHRHLQPYRHDQAIRGALRAVELLGTNAAPIADTVCRRFERGDAAARGQVIQVIPKLGPAVISSMRRFLADPDLRTRGYAAFVFHQLGPPGAEAAGELIGGLAGADENHRKLVAQTLGRMGPAVMPHVIELLGSDDPVRRLTGVQALDHVFPRDRAMTISLLSLLDDASPEIRRESAFILVRWWSLPFERWRKRIDELPADHPSRGSFEAIIQGLEQNEGRLVAVLHEGLRHADPMIRYQAAMFLINGRRATPDVTECLKELQASGAASQIAPGAITTLLAQLEESISDLAPETNSVPRTAPVSQSPASTAPPPAGKSP